MRQNPAKRKVPRTLSAAGDLEPDGVGETDAHDPADLAGAETAQTENRASTRGRRPRRHPGSETSYPVGYRRPPKHTQFKPGQSGNPRGRSPQSRNLGTIVRQVLDEQIPIRKGGRVRPMPTIEALFRSLLARAFKGDLKALTALVVMIKQSGYGTEVTEITPELPRGTDHEAIIADFLSRTGVDDPATSAPSTRPPRSGKKPA